MSGSQFSWSRNPIPELSPLHPDKEAFLTDVDKWMDELCTTVKAVGGAYMMKMFDNYICIGIKIPTGPCSSTGLQWPGRL